VFGWLWQAAAMYLASTAGRAMLANDGAR